MSLVQSKQNVPTMLWKANSMLFYYQLRKMFTYKEKSMANRSDHFFSYVIRCFESIFIRLCINSPTEKVCAIELKQS